MATMLDILFKDVLLWAISLTNALVIVFQTREDESKGTAIGLLHASVCENYQSNNGLTLGLSKGDSCNILEKYSIVSKKLEGEKPLNIHLL